MLDQPPNFSPRETSVTEPAFDLRQILSFVWRQWKFAAAITALVLVVGITILLRQTPLYTATAQVLLERQREKAPGAEAILAITDPDVAMVEGEIAILKSSVFLNRVVGAQLTYGKGLPRREIGRCGRMLSRARGR